MLHVIANLAYFAFIIGTFFVFPVVYQLYYQMASQWWITLLVLYFSFTAGYYLLYILLYTIKDRNGNLVLLFDEDMTRVRHEHDNQDPTARGIIEQASLPSSGSRDIRARIVKKSLLFSLLVLLLLAPFILYFFRDLQFSQVDGAENRYAIASVGQLLRLKIEADSKADLPFLDAVRKSDIVIVEGNYDKVETVLQLAKIPFTLVRQNRLSSLELSPDQILIINCPGRIPVSAFGKIKNFVSEGGYLFTTDWAILFTLQGAIPGFIAPAGAETRDEIMPIAVADAASEFTKFITPSGGTPAWWEFYSYPIKVLNADAVKVLVRSEKMKRAYGHDAIAVFFPFGKGKVIHSCSHFYQARSEIHSSRQAGDAYSYVRDELKVDPARLESDFREKLKTVRAGQIEDTYSVIRFIANVIIAKKKAAR